MLTLPPYRSKIKSSSYGAKPPTMQLFGAKPKHKAAPGGKGAGEKEPLVKSYPCESELPR